MENENIEKIYERPDLTFEETIEDFKKMFEVKDV